MILANKCCLTYFLQANLMILKLDNGKYRPLFKSSTFDWCTTMAGIAKSKSNPLVKTMLKIMTKAAKVMLHPCPFVGIHAVQNSTLDRSILMIYPAGDYRIILHTFNEFDDNIWTFKLNNKIF